MTNKKYFLHFRQSFFLLEIDSMLQGTDYLNVDYIYLYTPETNSFAGYLSQKGLKQARSLGEKKILNNKNWKKIFENTKKSFDFMDKLKNYKIPNIQDKEFNTFWRQIIKHAKIITSSYFYCEEPTLISLEEKGGDKTIYKTLSYIGKYKLKAHKKLSVIETFIYKLLSKFAKLHNLDIQNLENLTLEEFNDIVVNDINKKIIQRVEKRKNGYIYYQKKNKWVVDTGQEYKKWCKILLPKKTQIEVKGTTTYPVNKKITGKAKIHISFSKITKLAKDEILITGMTNPQIIPYIKNIRGIVTDEGGLMCHASIISREMKIPCIVGTKDGTQIFKNGDLIEMDTSKGTAKKLN